jgi:hypothetical protein
VPVKDEMKACMHVALVAFMLEIQKCTKFLFLYQSKNLRDENVRAPDDLLRFECTDTGSAAEQYDLLD